MALLTARLGESDESFFRICERYIIKYRDQVEKICLPLKNYLGINIFGYCSIHNDGTYCHLSNEVDFNGYFYENQLYFHQPYCRHPSLFNSGYTIMPVSQDSNYHKISKNIYKSDMMLLVINKYEEHMKTMVFGNYNWTESNYIHIINDLHLINKFIPYFKREAGKIIKKTQFDGGFNAKKELGDTFNQTDSSLALYSKKLKVQEYLNTISPLTPREQTCCDFYKLGHSAQSTAAILKISQRTVEHHFDNIKLKLGCLSKSELLNL